MPRIAIVEDEPSIRRELCLLLENAGYTSLPVTDFTNTAQVVLDAAPDLVLLDVNLLGQDGYSVCGAIRRQSRVPILFVTSKNSSMDEVKALSLGGDDFIAKPYNIPVLLARIQAMLRRGKPDGSEALTVGRLTLHLNGVSIQHGDKTAELAKNEVGILWCLMQRPGEIVPRADMIEFLWDNQVYIDDNTLSVNITRLRTKLRELGLEDYIQTKRGMGYKVQGGLVNMYIGDFLRDKLSKILLHLAGMLALSAFLLLTGTGRGVVGLVLLVWGSGLFVVLLAGYLRQRRHIKELWAILDSLPQKYLFMECAPRPDTAYEKQLFEIQRWAGKSMTEQVGVATRQQTEYRDYIESWVHEIKVPITAIQLICENNRSDITRKMLPQLAGVEEQVERALFCACSGQIAQDLVVRRTSLAAVVRDTLAKYRTLLIQSGVRVETDGLDVEVYTDAKWLEFMLGQLLSNAVKYRGDSPAITITAQGEGTGVALCVQDNGSGIPMAELPRVFDKGLQAAMGVYAAALPAWGYTCVKSWPSIYRWRWRQTPLKTSIPALCCILVNAANTLNEAKGQTRRA